MRRTLKILPLLIVMVHGCTPAGNAAGTSDAKRPGEATGDEACAATCKAVADCTPGKGHLTDGTCGRPYLVCCVPQGSCGGEEDFACCEGGATFRPICKDGRLQCPEGQSRGDENGCPRR